MRAIAILALIGGLGSLLANAQNNESKRPAKSAAPQTGAASKLPSPVLDTHQLMELFNQQWYMLVKEEMRREGQIDFETMRDRGLQAAEMANLVAIREEGEDPQWQQHALALRQAGIALGDAADKKDPQATRATYDKLIQTCNACHREFGGEEAPQLKP